MKKDFLCSERRQKRYLFKNYHAEEKPPLPDPPLAPNTPLAHENLVIETTAKKTKVKEANEKNSTTTKSCNFDTRIVMISKILGCVV